jgi:predicted metal-dependent hydrolase
LKLFSSFSIISSVLKDISTGINYFNNADFYLAHDFFEGMWADCNREDRKFFQGLIQVSVGCYHLTCNNYSGALNQLNKGILKLNDYLPSYYNLDLADLKNKINCLIKELESYFSNPSNEIDVGKIPTIKFN